MKRFVGIFALASIAIIGFAFMPAHVGKKGAACDVLTLSGEITPDTFHSFKDCLVRSTAASKTVLVTNSGGGNWESALALGMLIHRHGWNVEVVDLCASSCANFIFTAGKVKYLHREAMLLFHGGPHQENLIEMATEMDQAFASQGGPADATRLGRPNKEGSVAVDAGQSAGRREVLEFLSVGEVATVVDLVTRLRTLSDEFYAKLGVNPQLSNFGQVGRYESTYKSYKYGGYMYRLDSLRRMGVGNIEVKGGEWHPERNPVYHDVYEVTYP